MEIQVTDDALIAVGDSKARDRGALLFPSAAWTAFVTGAEGPAPVVPAPPRHP